MKEKELIDARQAIELIACVKLFLFDPIDLECDIDDSRNVLRVNIELLKEEKKQSSFYLITQCSFRSNKISFVFVINQLKSFYFFRFTHH